jgi:AcrR family transcriptional regulator
MNELQSARTAEIRPRKRRADGEQSRNAILREAARLATVEGIGGLSIGRLATAVGMSKSGLFAHFGSKAERQLATIETASDLYSELVVGPALAEPTGIQRLRALAERFLEHVQRNDYPGGCFFASVAAELDTHPGPVRDLAIGMVEEWFAELVRAVEDGQAEGSIDLSEDPGQLAFEIDSYLLLANAQYVVSGEPTPIERARRALDRRLALAAPAG